MNYSIVPQKIVILRHAIWALLMECSIFAVAQFLFNCSLDERDRPVTANMTTVILMEKGVDATPSRQFVAVQSPGVYCRKMQCTTVSETDRPTRHRTCLHPCAAPVSPVSRYRNDSQQRGTGFVLANRYM